MENREMILQTDTLSWFVNLSELLRQADMNRNIHMTLEPERSSYTSILTAGKVRTYNTNLQISIKHIKAHVFLLQHPYSICSVDHMSCVLLVFTTEQIATVRCICINQ